jgi:hypothetical protein
MKDVAQWARAFQKVADEYPEKVYMPTFRKAGFKIAAIAAELSPVNYGNLRNGWHVSINSPTRFDNKVASGRGGLSAVMESASRQVNTAKMGDTIWIQNNTEYAGQYEFGLFEPANPGPSSGMHAPEEWRSEKEGKILISQGYSISAPRGMLGDAGVIVYGMVISGRI